MIMSDQAARGYNHDQAPVVAVRKIAIPGQVSSRICKKIEDIQSDRLTRMKIQMILKII